MNQIKYLFKSIQYVALIFLLLSCSPTNIDHKTLTSNLYEEKLSNAKKLDKINISNLPILNYDPSQGDQILLKHKLTQDELALFSKMDQATIDAGNPTDPKINFDIVTRVGKQYRLTREQSIAFRSRSTFSLFEP
jgi:hypothetical protein